MRWRTALPIAGFLLVRCLPAELELDTASKGGSGGQAGEPAISLGGDAGSPEGGGAVEGGMPSAGMGGAGNIGNVVGMAGEAGAPVVPPQPCDDPRIIQLFDFSDSSKVVNAPATVPDEWAKGPYDSTDTKTHALDKTSNPNTNPTNLANLSRLDIDQDHGNEAPAMRYAIPFSRMTEQVNLIYMFAVFKDLKHSVDMTHAVMTASAKLARPRSGCEVKAFAWSTIQELSGKYVGEDGEKVVLSATEWRTITLNIRERVDADIVNQYGFAFQSACSEPEPPAGVGGVDAGGAGGASDGSDDATVVLIDNILTQCFGGG